MNLWKLLFEGNESVPSNLGREFTFDQIYDNPELQHIIQRYEKFSRGGSLQTVKAELLRNRDMITKAISKISNGKNYFDSILALEKAHEADNEETISKARREMQAAKQEVAPKDREKIESFAERFKELRKAKADTKSAREQVYSRLGGEQEARHAEERLDNRTSTPVAHDSDALIVFGGKTYAIAKQPVNKKIADRNSDGELVERGSKIPPAATANGTTDTAVTNATAGSDNKGGVSPSANVETNSPRQNIAQANATDKSTSTVFGSKEYAMANMTELEKKEANEIERNIAKGKKAMAEIIKNHGDINLLCTVAILAT